MRGPLSSSIILRIFVLLLLLFLSLPTASTALSVHVSVPDRWRLNSRGQPRLCSAVGATLNVLARVGLCVPSSVEKFHLQVKAQSNRAVLRGKLDQVSLQVIQSKSSLLHVQELALLGSNLDLGWTPLVLTALPVVIFLTRPPLLKIFAGWYLWKMVQKYFLQATKTPLASPSSGKVQKWLGGTPCHLEYSITFNNDNLSQSILLRHASIHLLRSLLSNSVLPQIAALGDTAQLLQDGQAQVDPTTGQLVLKQQDTLMDQIEIQNKNYQLSKLLSATSFDLRGSPYFLDNGGGWMVLPSQATFPQQQHQARLDFVLRTKPQTTDGMLEFASPEVRLDVDTVVPTIPKVIGQLLPKIVWLPVGSGVAVSAVGRKRHCIQRVGIANGACRIDGRITLVGSQQHDSTSGAIVRN
jgi:hypothetical protein